MVLKEHLNEVESKAKQGSGGRGRGSQLTCIQDDNQQYIGCDT